MDVFLARQPIHDDSDEIYGYEILYRDSSKNCYPSIDGNEATKSALTRCFIDFGIDEITDNKKAFVNFTSDLLKKEIATIFPKDYLVIEILEDVIIDDEIAACCKKLKQLGYSIAIDDFIYQNGYEKIFDIIDIIKVDFKESSKEERREFIKKYKRKNLEFLAEKVEDYDEYCEAKDLGYKYFQGYYFSKPEISSKKKIMPFKGNYIKLMNLINSENPKFSSIAHVIEHDVAFSYEILQLVNSAYFQRRNQITSIRYAIVTLGINELKKWIYLVFVRDFCQCKYEEVLIQCMLRGKFMEGIALKANKHEIRLEMMTVGLFSMIDVLTNKNLYDILKEINFSDSIRMILTRQQTEGFIAESFDIVLKYEKGYFVEVEESIDKIGISISDLNEAYIDALKWIKKVGK